MLWIIIVFVVVIVNNAGVVLSFNHGGGGVVDNRRVVSLLTVLPIQRQRRIDHLMNNGHNVSREGGGGFFISPHVLTRRQQDKNHNNGVGLASTNCNNDDIDNNNEGEGGGEDKFSFYQRIESIKTAILGGIAGSICSSPFIAIHDLLLPSVGGGGLATWEFDTDASAIQGALFAIVYRYCIRASDTKNDMLNMGVIGAFILVRTTSRIQIPTYCTAIPLTCGPPLGYLDYTILFALLVNSVEGLALFGSVAYCMEYAYNKAWISKFP